MKRIGKSLRMVIAAAALVSVGAAGCATNVSGTVHQSRATPRESTSPKSTPTAQAGFAGYKWQVVAIDHGGKETPIPARSNVYLAFTPNGDFVGNDPINIYDGTYRGTGDGFTIIGPIVGSTVGYAGNDATVLLAINAISAFDNGVHAAATATGDRLAVSVGGYLLTCQRDGTQANFPPAQPT